MVGNMLCPPRRSKQGKLCLAGTMNEKKYNRPWLLSNSFLFLYRFFANIYNPMMKTYHKTCRELKRQHFDSMKNHQSADPELRKKGALRVLEIGPGPGYNFEFYPKNCELTVVEVNGHFRDQFFAKQVDHPQIKLDRFIVGFAEDMKGIPDNSIDIVVSTMVLCSVRDVDKALKEIKRVLAPVSSNIH